MLMIDEPSLGLSPPLVNEVYRHIEGIMRSGVTLLLVEEKFSHVHALRREGAPARLGDALFGKAGRRTAGRRVRDCHLPLDLRATMRSLSRPS